jgi:hypothetical protein
MLRDGNEVHVTMTKYLFDYHDDNTGWRRETGKFKIIRKN